MAFVPHDIDMTERQRIVGTPWSFVQHSPTLRFYFHEDLPDWGHDSYHVSVFSRQSGIDIHATYVFQNQRTRQWFKRHHGWCYNTTTNQQVKRKCRRPYDLHRLFNAFQEDMETILEPYLLQFLPPVFYSDFRR